MGDLVQSDGGGDGAALAAAGGWSSNPEKGLAGGRGARASWQFCSRSS